MFDVTLDRELCDAIKLGLKSDSSPDGIETLNCKLIIFGGFKSFHIRYRKNGVQFAITFTML